MSSISKKKIAIIEKNNQEKLRNQAMKIGVTLKSPEIGRASCRERV